MSRIHLMAIAVLTFLLCGGVAAQQEVPLARVLLPISLTEPLPGALGSVWTTDLWVRNGASVPVLVFPLDFGCGPIGTCAEVRVPAGVAFQPQAVFAFNNNGIPGVLLHIEQPHQEQVDVELRVRDLSRQGETWGTELPVVPEEEFTVGKVTLLDVPQSEGFRVLLRVYGLADVAGTSVLVRVFNLHDARFPNSLPPVLIGEQTLALRSAPEDIWIVVPHYAQLDLSSQGSTGGRVMIEVTPISQNLRIWGFATITHNTSQHVTVVSPK